MKTTPRLLTLLATLAFVTAPATLAQLSVGNVHAAQRTGTKLVDIDFDIAGIAAPVAVSLEISADGGTTWGVPATTATGAVGSSVTPGSNLRITWNAGADWPSQTSAQTRFRIKVGDSPEFTLIPAGGFQMGNSFNEGNGDQVPIRTVQVSAFNMAKHETTKALWDSVKDWGLLHEYTDLAYGAGRAADNPVQTLSWHDMVKWCNARSEKEGLTPCYYTDDAQTVIYRTGATNITNTMVKWSAYGYRLPTEAEWEKAARGGLSDKRFPWGDTISHNEANYYGSGSGYDLSSGFHPPYLGSPNTSPVGRFPANGYGLYDMAGNVKERCWDSYGDYPAGTATDPHGPDSNYGSRVTRGGSWDHDSDYCRVACRVTESTGYAWNHIGFRIVRPPSPTAESPNTAIDTYRMNLTVNAIHGTVPGAGQYDPNTTATLTPTPSPGYVFTEWTGNATGTDNPLSVLMDSDKTITANFGPDPADDDIDGLTNYQEIVVYGTNPTLRDSDGDGYLDGYEVATGKSPLNIADHPALVAEARTAIEFTFPSALGKTYRIEGSPDMSTWTTVESGIAGNGGQIQRFYSTRNAPQRFLRVEEVAAP